LERKILKTEGGNQELEITLLDEEFDTYYKSAYHKVKNELQLHGFRKGKIPFHIAKKHFGHVLETDAIELASQTEFQKAIEEDKIHIVGQPAITNVDKNNGAVKFTISYEIYPEFTLGDYKGISIDEPVHAVTEDEIGEEVQKILNANGTFEDAEDIDDENFIVGVTLSRVNPETKDILEEYAPIEENLYLNDERLDKELINSLIGHKIGEKVYFEQSHNHDHDEHDHNHEIIAYDVQIKDVQKLIPKELSDEFVKEHSKEKFDTIDDFKDDIEFSLQEKWDKESRIALENQVVAKLVDENDFDIPDAFVQNAIDSMLNNYKQQFSQMPDADKLLQDPKIREEMRPSAERSVKWEMIRGKIVETEGIEVEDFDIEQMANQEATRTGNDAQKLVEMFSKNENVKQQILAKKALDYVLDFAITNEVSFDDIEN
jgi:trigger factor